MTRPWPDLDLSLRVGFAAWFAAGDEYGPNGGSLEPPPPPASPRSAATNASARSLASPGKRLLAGVAKATLLPSAVIDGNAATSPLAPPPSRPRETGWISPRPRSAA